jgi:hypothetical protein
MAAVQLLRWALSGPTNTFLLYSVRHPDGARFLRVINIVTRVKVGLCQVEGRPQPKSLLKVVEEAPMSHCHSLGSDAVCLEISDEVTEMAPNGLDTLVNYRARYRRRELISTGFVESSINEIIAKRMTKKQQMRWNGWTVQPFLDVRVAVLDGTLEGSFREMYPEFRSANDHRPASAAT